MCNADAGVQCDVVLFHRSEGYNTGLIEDRIERSGLAIEVVYLESDYGKVREYEHDRIYAGS